MITTEALIIEKEREIGALYDKIDGLGVCMMLDRKIDQELVQEALRLEQQVWELNGFNVAGSLDDYSKYNDQSRIFAVFSDGGECLGISRVFEGKPMLPPFLGLPISDDILKKRLESGCKSGSTEEIATAAVAPNVPYGTASVHMWRLAYRDAIERGIKKWGIIMEPRRVAAMNRAYGFCFEQIGSEAFYQGGNCASHTLDMKKAQSHMKRVNTEAYNWFTIEPLNK